MVTTQQEIVYNKLEALVARGSSLADAVREVAKETGKTENTVRALRYNQMRKLKGGAGSAARRVRNAPVSAEAAVAEAKKLLSQAVGAVDRELDAARKELDAAKARYDALAASAEAKKSDLQKKLAALG
jgi:predicted RNase H-like nuclease (RuvC/YqgF family)